MNVPYLADELPNRARFTVRMAPLLVRLRKLGSELCQKMELEPILNSPSSEVAPTPAPFVVNVRFCASAVKVRMMLNASLITMLFVPCRIKSCTWASVVGVSWLATISTRKSLVTVKELVVATPLVSTTIDELVANASQRVLHA